MRPIGFHHQVCVAGVEQKERARDSSDDQPVSKCPIKLSTRKVCEKDSTAWMLLTYEFIVSKISLNCIFGNL
jgi:hypothetical protein